MKVVAMVSEQRGIMVYNAKLIKSNRINSNFIYSNLTEYKSITLCTIILPCSSVFTLVPVVVTCHTFHQWLQLTARPLKATAMVAGWNNGEQGGNNDIQENFTRLS